jgi:glycosyltransferase involved in cell wall biosynthesis
MAIADVFLMPSYEDAYPLVVLEAMAAGLPVVVTANVGTSELLHDGINGYVVAPGDAEALANSLEHLVSNQAERKRVGSAARATVSERATWRQYAVQAIDSFASASQC